MTKRVEKLLAKSLAVLSYALPIGLAISRALGPKGAPAPKQVPIAANVNATPPAPVAEQKLESLSLDTPGDAPLDRLARRAAWEQRQENQPEHSKLKASVSPGSVDLRVPDPDSVSHLLHTQTLESYPLEGWSVPEPQRLPIPTFAPAVMAFGIVIFAMGLATVWYVCLVGSLVFTVAAWRWVGELQGE